MRITTTIGIVVMLGIALLASTPAYAQIGSSQGGAMTPLTPLPSMYNPPAPLSIGGSSSSSQMWPWYGGEGAYGFAAPQSYGTGGPKPYGVMVSPPSYDQLGQSTLPSPTTSPNTLGNTLPGLSPATAPGRTTSVPPSYPSYPSYGEHFGSPPAAAPLTMPTFPTSGPQSFQGPQYQPAASYGASSASGSALTKPFANYKPAPAISPYMGLYQTNTDVGVSNYNQFVRPALEQIETNRQLEWQGQSLQSAVSGPSMSRGAGAVGVPGASGMPSTSGSPVQPSMIGAPGPPPNYYMNLRSYYPGYGGSASGR